MADLAIIGGSTRIRGRVTGAVDLELQGFLEGEVTLDGDLTVGATGLVAANLQARRIVVRGAVKGDVKAEESVHLEDGARVVGDIHAPRVAIAPGALVRGYVQTGDGHEARPRARTTSAVHASGRNGAMPAKDKVPVTVARPVPTAKDSAPARGRVPEKAAKAGPPAPVMPALKKGSKGALLKKRA